MEIKGPQDNTMEVARKIQGLNLTKRRLGRLLKYGIYVPVRLSVWRA